MKRILLLFFIIFSYTFVSAQTTICDPNIISLCDPGPYAASVSGTASAPAGTDFGCNPTVTQSSFFYFEAGTSGPLSIDIDPVDVNGNPLGNDLDYICWGPFSSTANMCNNLTNVLDCSVAGGFTNEVCNITANAGSIYVLLIENWGFSPLPCFIDFTPNDPFSCCKFAGDDNTISKCDTDSPFGLITGLNNNPSNNGSWEDATGNAVSNMFDPSTDAAGIYSYIIPANGSCIADTGFVNVNIIITPNLSITPLTACSGTTPITLTGTPAGTGGTFSGTNVTAGTFNPSIIGNNIITYTYTENGCTSVLNENIEVLESPTVLPQDEVTTKPKCPGDSSGTAIVTPTSGSFPYNYEYYGEDFLALPAGIFNYTITDANLCTFDGNVTIYDPIINTPILTTDNSSCFHANNGSIVVTMNSPPTPPGTVSDPLDTLGYCLSAPNSSVQFTSAPASSIIENVTLTGDNNSINNNTAGVADSYEDYTNNTGLAGEYADITEGESYTVNVTLNGLGSTAGQNYSGAKVYIDYNIDGVFDATEEVGVVPYTDITTIGIAEAITFTVPATGVYGPSRMRVVSQFIFGSNSSSIGPCDYADPLIPFSLPWHGATEDYSIVLNAPALISSILWSDSTTLDSITDLSPGIYSVIITTSICTIEDSAEVLEPAQLFFNADINNILCNDTTGQIFINPSGGNGGPYATDWGVIDPLALTDGSFTITLSDSSTITTSNPDACDIDTTIVIVEPAYFSVDFTTSSNEICLNDSVTLDFDFNQGGIAPFSINYTLNTVPQASIPINNGGANSIPIYPTVGNNTYAITSISDSGGCINQNSISQQSIRVNELPDINIVAAPNPICVGDSATVILSTPKGKPPYVVDYFDGGVATTVNVPGANLNILVSPTTNTTYTLSFVIDDNGCESNLTDQAILIVNEVPELNTSYQTEFCEGEPIEIDLDFTVGTPPFNVDYTFNGTPTSTTVNNQQSTLSFVSTNPTNIIINTIKSKNCINAMNETIGITTNPLPIANISGNYVLCDDGQEANILIATTDGAPFYNIVYTNGTNIDSIPNATSNQTFKTNTSGVYSLLSITDSKGCESINMNGFATVTINPLPDVAVSAHPTHTEITDPLIYFKNRSGNHVSGIWDFDDGQTQASNFNTINHIYSDTGTYQASLTTFSIDGCENTAYQTIIISPTFTIYIPNAFTPNNDLDNDYFMPILEGVQDFEMSIYDGLGQRIFRTTEYSNEYCIRGCKATWDGTINNGEYGTIGIYIYHLIITDINGKLRNFEGTVTLIR